MLFIKLLPVICRCVLDAKATFLCFCSSKVAVFTYGQTRKPQHTVLWLLLYSSIHHKQGEPACLKHTHYLPGYDDINTKPQNLLLFLNTTTEHGPLPLLNILYRSFSATLLVFWSLGLRAGLAASIAGSSIISKMLLANIDPFGATPFIDPDLDPL